MHYTYFCFFVSLVSRWFINRISYFSLVVLTFSSCCICRPKESKSSAHVAAFRLVLLIPLASDFWQGSHMREWNGCGVVDICFSLTVLAIPTNFSLAWQSTYAWWCGRGCGCGGATGQGIRRQAHILQGIHAGGQLDVELRQQGL